MSLLDLQLILIRLRAEVVSKHFEPEAIIEQSNIEYTADAPKYTPQLLN